MLVVTR